jgi:hypothetical protein
MNAFETLEQRALFASAVALSTTNDLLRFDTSNPGEVTSTRKVTNLRPGESILAIDARPATGQLYGLGSSSRLYRINPSTGAATQVGDAFAFPLAGDSFDLDFNPTVDRIRVVSNADQNFRLNPDTGAVVDGDMATDGIQPDGDLAFDAGDPGAGADPLVVGAAYGSNFPGATTTTLYAIDSAANALLTQGSPGGSPTSPNTGALFTVGSLGIDVTKRLGFDIVTANGTDSGFAVFQVAGEVRPSLYSVNLTTGAAAPVARIGARQRIADVAILPAQINLIALGEKNELIAFDAADPATAGRRVNIKGLQRGEAILAIDFRPATDELYGLGSSSRLYKIDPASGRATAVGSPFALPLRGTSFDLDFNPAVDRVRVVSNANQNLRLNPDTGAVVDGEMGTAGVQSDADLSFAAGDANEGVDPVIVGAAYSRNFAATTTTTLFGIDSGRDVLVTQGSVGGTPSSPNLGQLFTVGALGVDVTSRLGLDIASNDGVDRALGAFQIAGTSAPVLFSINLRTGAATRIGALGGGQLFADIAIVPR